MIPDLSSTHPPYCTWLEHDDFRLDVRVSRRGARRDHEAVADTSGFLAESGGASDGAGLRHADRGGARRKEGVGRLPVVQ